MNALPTWLVPGVVVGGKYALVRLLGKGGMGAVFEARHGTLGGHVALKVLLGSGRAAEDVARFLREARASFTIASEHVARVLDAGTAQNGEPYLVMELLEGSDLAQVLAQRGALPVAEAVEHVAQAAAGLAAAHAIGIVHRDVKPANLFVTRRPDGSPLVKVLDFGIAKAAEPFEPQLTETTAAFGTLPYMSPEQVKASRDVDARADVYSLGVVLFELLAGSPPLMAPSAAELVVEILHRPTPPLRALRPDVPPALEAVVARATSKSRDDRFPSMELFVAAARAALTDAGAAALAPTAPLAPPLPYGTAGPSPTAPTANVASALAPTAYAMAPHPNAMPVLVGAHAPPRPLARPGNGGATALVATGGVATTGGVLAFVAAAIPGVVNGAEIGTAIAIGVAACVVGGALLAGGLASRRS